MQSEQSYYDNDVAAEASARDAAFFIEDIVEDEDGNIHENTLVAPKKSASLKNNLSMSDVDNLREIYKEKGEISVNDFASKDIKASENWAKNFYSEIGNKSPFFRAWFGDWRANEKTKVSIVFANKKTGKNPRGTFINKDTG